MESFNATYGADVIDANDIKFCAKGNFFYIRYREDPDSLYEFIEAQDSYDGIVDFLRKEGFSLINVYDGRDS